MPNNSQTDQKKDVVHPVKHAPATVSGSRNTAQPGLLKHKDTSGKGEKR